MTDACWSQVTARVFADRPALFLDRDGVLVEEVGYLRRAQDVSLAPGAARLVAAANRAGMPVVVVTNQSGVAREYFGWSDFEAVQAEIARRLAQAGARLDAVFACGAHACGQGPLGVADHPWRKPRPGMLLAARDVMSVDLARSVIVGDRAQDLAAGRAAGLGSGVHLATGHGAEDQERSAALALATSSFAVRLAPDLTGLLDLVRQAGEGVAL